MRSGASVLISGASGSGKTTLLRALLEEVSDQRVIAIEDVPELLLETDSFVGLLARAANTEGRGAIELDQLLVESLRMRPDRIVVGEVRSKELVTLLQAANSGHAVAATIHANAVDRVLERMASIGLASSITATAVRQLSSAIDAFIHIDVHDAKRTLTIREAN
jgi:pilus assembly protein CpaF